MGSGGLSGTTIIDQNQAVDGADMAYIYDRQPGYASTISVANQADALKLNSCLGDADGDGTLFTVDQYDDATTDDTADPADTPYRKLTGSNGGAKMAFTTTSASATQVVIDHTTVDTFWA